MINCGGTVDLKEFFNLDQSVSIYVLDSHRPYHLNNVRDTNEQVVFVLMRTKINEAFHSISQNSTV